MCAALGGALVGNAEGCRLSGAVWMAVLGCWGSLRILVGSSDSTSASQALSLRLHTVRQSCNICQQVHK